MLANGPWTNISEVFTFIKNNCTNPNDKFLVFTDGKQELEDGSDSFELTDEILKSRLNKNAHFVQKGQLKFIEYTYEKEEFPVKEIKTETLATEPTPKINAVVSEKPSQKKNVSPMIIVFGTILLLLLLIVLLLVLKNLSRRGSGKNLKDFRAKEFDKNLGARIAVSENYTNSEHSDFSAPKTENSKSEKEVILPESKRKRLENEKAHEINIREETAIIKKMQTENPDVVITPDGSYPNYYNQILKIVIIGREDRGLYGADLIDTLLGAYKKLKIGVNNGYESPNQLGVHRKSLKYVFGLIHNLDYKDIPNANDLGKKLGEKDEFSYAALNESKVSNMRDDSQVLNRPQYEDFVDRNAKKGYMREQMGVLKPDLAIGQRISEKTINSLGKAEKIASENGTDLYKITSPDGRVYKLINNRNHFSARAVSDEVEYSTIRKLANIKI